MVRVPQSDSGPQATCGRCAPGGQGAPSTAPGVVPSLRPKAVWSRTYTMSRRISFSFCLTFLMIVSSPMVQVLSLGVPGTGWEAGPCTCLLTSCRGKCCYATASQNDKRCWCCSSLSFSKPGRQPRILNTRTGRGSSPPRSEVSGSLGQWSGSATKMAGNSLAAQCHIQGAPQANAAELGELGKRQA